MSRKEILWRACVFVGAAPALGAFLWHTWEFHILPRRIPREEIERLAEELTRKHPVDPAY